MKQLFFFDLNDQQYHKYQNHLIQPLWQYCLFNILVYLFFKFQLNYFALIKINLNSY